MGTICLSQVLTFLDRLAPLVANIALLSELSPMVDEAPERGRLGIGLLVIIADYAARLDAELTAFSETLRRERLSP